MDMEEGIFCKKIVHPRTFMPSGIVHPEVDGLSFETINDLPQHLNKPIGIAADPLHDSMRSLDEIHPSKDIQPLLMLTPDSYRGRLKLLNLINAWRYVIRDSCQENHE